VHAIDHFHYDVTCAKVSGSCSKDRAQYRAFAGKVSKNQQKRHVSQGQQPGDHKCCVLDCYINSKKVGVEFFLFFFFSVDEELGGALLTLRQGFFWSLNSENIKAMTTRLKRQIVRPKIFPLRSTTLADDVI